jgi:hypothetical protein
MRLAFLLIAVLIAAAVVYSVLPLLGVVVAAFIGICAVLPLAAHVLCCRDRKIVKCPKTGGPAEIELNASRSADPSACVKLSDCSLWYKFSGCNQSCVK